MCAFLRRWCTIPWHKENPRPVDVMRMVSFPLLTSLIATMVAINIMVFIQMNHKSVDPVIYVMSYLSPAVGFASFMAFILATVYGKWILVPVGLLIYDVFVILYVAISSFILRKSPLESKVDYEVLLTIRVFVGVFLVVITLMTIRMVMTCTAFSYAIMVGGRLWDVDVNKNRQEHRGTTPSTESV
ncbi:hypothetical protein BgAZ_305490 [Babesia gibsoni]|uniref:Uncharacterized protein n=1 Tax=Babesia gibsoni TaxID=33632 RepID=A0AAD8LPU1_BABGI|nr:hypothetical protein BgAZ_305490 [Babesia gibsoni]